MPVRLKKGGNSIRFSARSCRTSTGRRTRRTRSREAPSARSRPGDRQAHRGAVQLRPLNRQEGLPGASTLRQPFVMSGYGFGHDRHRRTRPRPGPDGCQWVRRRLVAAYLARQAPPRCGWHWRAGRRSGSTTYATRSASGRRSGQFSRWTPRMTTRHPLAGGSALVVSTVGPLCPARSAAASARAPRPAPTTPTSPGRSRSYAADNDVAHEDLARSTGARIVHACGFDSSLRPRRALALARAGRGRRRRAADRTTAGGDLGCGAGSEAGRGSLRNCRSTSAADPARAGWLRTRSR